MAYKTEYYTVEETRSRVNFVNFDDVGICRPKFIYFKVSGLWPNKRHFAFFDRINVSNYINTDNRNITDYGSLSRNDQLRNPGDKYTSETGFPQELGGPDTAIYSDANGVIEGIFYLQSNSALNFPNGTRTFEFFDTTRADPDIAISYAAATYVSDGGIENYETEYYTVVVEKSKQVWVPDPPSNTSSSSNNDNDAYTSPYATVYNSSGRVGTFTYTGSGTPDHTVQVSTSSDWTRTGD